MKKNIVVEAPTLEECLKKGCDELKCRKDNIDYEVLTEGKKGLFGLISQPYKIRVFAKTEESSDQQDIDRFLEDVEKLDVDVNGFMDIRRENDGIFLIIIPPKGKGYRVTLDQAVKFVQDSGIVNSDFDAISEAVNNADEKPVRIAEYDPALYKDGEAQLILSKDLMNCELLLIPPKGGNPVSIEKLNELIREKGIRMEINFDEIKKSIDNRIYNQPIMLASGNPAKNGDDARIDYKFKPRKDKIAPAMREDGGVDFRKLNLIDNVVRGETLGEKIPATSGEPGMNLLGESIPAVPGKDIMLTPGKNVSLSDDGMRMIADIDGQVSFKKNVLSVMPVFSADGDVDFSVGDIDFVGNVVVRDNVLDGFQVKCKGDLEVGKTIGACIVEATGDIVVKGGILGKDKGVIRSEGSIYAKFIENCECEAKEDIIVERAIMHSKVRAKKIIVSSSKGLLVGGEIQAEEEIESVSIGSNLATKTTIILGVSKDLLMRINEIEKSCEDTAKNLAKLNQAVAMFARIKERSGELDETNSVKLSKTLTIKKQLESTLAELETTKQQLEEQLESTRGGRVRAQKVIYPGVNVTIGKGILQVKDEIKFASLVYEEGYVKIKPFS